MFLRRVTGTLVVNRVTLSAPLLLIPSSSRLTSTSIRKMSHQAIVCRNTDGWKALKLEQVETPKPGENQVLIRVGAAGVNFPDVLICEGKYQMKPPYPFTPGGEAAGTVIELGPGVKKFKVGDRVAVMPGWGGFQEKLVASADKCIRVPDFMPTDVASGLFFTYGTSLHALKDRGEVKPGDTVLILGASGGVGVAAIEISKALGATVIAAASSPEKLEVCKKFGADLLINYSTENLKNRVNELTEGRGVDVVYDAVGGAHAEPALRSMAWRGRYLVIGFVGGIPKIPLNLALLKGCSIVGVFWGMFTAREPQGFEDDINLLMKWYGEKKLKPEVTGRFPLKDAPLAIGEMAQRRVVGKVVVVCDSSSKM